MALHSVSTRTCAYSLVEMAIWIACSPASDLENLTTMACRRRTNVPRRVWVKSISASRVCVCIFVWVVLSIFSENRGLVVTRHSWRINTRRQVRTQDMVAVNLIVYVYVLDSVGVHVRVRLVVKPVEGVHKGSSTPTDHYAVWVSMSRDTVDAHAQHYQWYLDQSTVLITATSRSQIQRPSNVESFPAVWATGIRKVCRVLNTFSPPSYLRDKRGFCQW